jgi:methionine aminopeptidase
MDIIQNTKYHTCATLCSKIYNKLKEMIINNKERNIKVLCEYGNNLIQSELNGIFKKEKNKNIGFPVSISLNNCVGNYIGDTEINVDDIIKIELGINISGCIAVLAETFSINENKELDKYNRFLDKIKNSLLKMIKNGETGDEIRIFIESKCTEMNVFPVENCTSYQSDINYLKTSDSKYFTLNYCKQYDQEEMLVNQNINYEFEENDVYNIDLTIIPESDSNSENDSNLILSSIDPVIYSLNENVYGLKLKNSREFYNEIKSKHHFNPFNIQDYKQKFSSGIRETCKNNLLNVYPIMYTNYKNKYNKKQALRNGPNVFTKKFTIIIGNEQSRLLNY